ncbi:MBL fold metallo-hydrolase [Lysinibacillus sp. NPDC047702]|uniref:MBL fold metallo-hydrolase n=1 Tax=unclassified Lysinibacillus TaxID=2636778 RepID=UPI003CFD17E9
MNIQQIRNATVIIEYAEKKFLIDPLLANEGTFPPYPNSLRQDQNNPLVSLPASIDQLINVDAVIVTHLHVDHFDEVAKEVLPKAIKMFVQNEEDAKEIKSAGFTNVEILQEDTVFEGVQLMKTAGQHGRGKVLEMTGQVCGVIFHHSSEKKLYVAGDTVWYNGVQKVLEKNLPDIIIVNGGDNQFLQGGSLIMGKDDIYEVYRAAPNAKIVVSHMEAINHWTLSREELRSFLNEKEINDRVLVPEDGEHYMF